MLEQSRSDVTSKLVIIIVTAPVGPTPSCVSVCQAETSRDPRPSAAEILPISFGIFPDRSRKRFRAQVSNVSKKPERPCGARLERYENVR